MTNKVTVNWVKDMQFESDNPSGHKFLIDANQSDGGSGNGLTPKALMLSGLAGCTGFDIASLLKKMKVGYDKLFIEVEGELTDEHPKYYSKVVLTYNFYGSELDEAKIQKAIKLSVDKYCGVMEMFRRFAEVKIDVNFNRS